MTYYFTDEFREDMGANIVLGGDDVAMYLFSTAPALGDSDGGTNTKWVGVDTVDQLALQLGWGPYIACPPLTVTSGVDGTLHWVASQNFTMPVGMPDTQVKVLVFTHVVGASPNPATDQIIFATDSLMRGGTVITDVDSIFPAEDPNTTENVLFYWNTTSGTEDPDGREGELRILKGPPDWEVANTQHVWIYPQRVNFIANPSFELGTDYWRCAAGNTKQQKLEAPPGGGSASGRVSGTAPLIFESNIFPLNYGRRKESGWTIQLKARGEGTLQVGMISWDPSFTTTGSDWGPEGGFVLNPTAYTVIRTLRAANESTSGMLRLECDGGWFEIDQVCVEPGLLPENEIDWPYFDGDDEFGYGERGDYTWYGGETQSHKSYSCWYNLRYATFGRIFGEGTADVGDVFSDEEAELQGVAWQWVPAGVPLTYTLDVLYPHDPQSPLPPVVGSVLPYATDTTDGVTSPW